MLRFTRALDPRPHSVAASLPIEGAVNIPFEELSSRVYELPPKTLPLEVVGGGAWAEQAVAWLGERGWRSTASSDLQAGEGVACLWRPNELLVEAIRSVPPGRALDLACGVGREAVYLASLGWTVAAVDHLPDALERARALQARYAPQGAIEWKCADVGALSPVGAFDLIGMFFHFDADVLRRCGAWLAPGGRLVVETFTPDHRERFGKPRPARVVRASDLAALDSSLVIEHCSEGWSGPRHTARLIARRAS